MKIQDLTQNLTAISDLYSKRFSIERTPEWYLIKIQEELGELASAYLKMTGRARTEGVTANDLKKNFEDEIADVLAMTMLFAKSQGVDIEKALQQKWYKHLEEARSKSEN